MDGGARLSGLDGAFLALESETTHLHIVGVLVLDPVDTPGEVTFRRIRSHIAERLPSVPPFRMRLAPAPLGIAQPKLVDDRQFDLDYHVRRAGLPRPGGRRELEGLVADIASRPLDRRRPLWEMHVVDGLGDGGVAVIAKVHHAIIDGVAGAELLAIFFDLEPRPEVSSLTRLDRRRATSGHLEGTTPEMTASEPVGGRHGLDPSSAIDGSQLSPRAAGAGPWAEIEPWVGALGSVPSQIDAAVRSLGRTLRRIGSATGARRRLPAGSIPRPLRAPKTSINRAISSRRRVVFAEMTMTDVRRVREVLGGTTNDVVLAAGAGSLRAFFGRRSEAHDDLVALVPVSVRTGSAPNGLGNQLSALLVSIPIALEDPVGRLAAVRESAAAAKEVEGGNGADLLRGWAAATAPAVTSHLSQLATGRRLFDRLPPLFNLVISNVPGPGFPLYLAGMRLRTMYPLGPVIEGAAVNITVLSYLDRIQVGVQACWDLVPDVEIIARGIEDSLAELVRAADRRDRPVPWWHGEVVPA